ncbi:Uncharacterized protein AArcCO_1630 [Halalkaliarchaeum sp. AArc-CO]|uniref:CRTAC1 family protein n=1 Tax=unclassified Halalkaliarchaeum TaxID=2678344 RepID=UPI00217F11FB|nr:MULTISPECIES: CRTAC1 family protein [unclassified Halalkaliarchaeum]MDR5673854.1 CRTAC1 family protein [Halalkaliarchaeum sp. AArc-GB]UWG50932.1 Uncharacterized protein AArcCO_1630 [Halalkaliarchaeum sp. AArc-CO]
MFGDVSDRLVDDGAMRGYGAAVTPGRRGPIAFVCGYDGNNRLYQPAAGSDGGDDLVDVACGIVADSGRHAIGVAAADLDADGCEELYVHNTDTFGGVTADGDLLLDRAAADRDVWRDVFALEVNEGRENFRSGRSVAAIDRFGTGQYGVAIACYGSELRYYELGEDGELTDMAPALGVDVTCGGRSVCAGPLVSDGMDLYLGVDGGPNRLFENGGGNFSEVDSAAELADPDGNTRGLALVGATDLPDGEEPTRSSMPAAAGAFELAVGNWEGPGRIFRPGKSGFEDVAPSEFARPASTRTLIAADFDNDGHVELFQNCLGEANALFRRRLDGWTELDPGDALEPTGFGTGAVVADFDDDGTLELLIVHGEVAAQPPSLYAVENDNDWLRVAPTTAHGAPARGAVVELETDETRKRRLVDAGSSYLCQSEPVAHFGLGGETPRRLRVWWPGGYETTVDSPETCRELVVEHPRRR